MKINSYNELMPGTTIRKIGLHGLVLSETTYLPNLQLPTHTHQNAYFCFVLKGNFIETYEKQSRLCGYSSLIFHPREEKHSDLFHTPTRCFNFQINNSWLARLGKYSVNFERSADISGVHISQLVKNLHKEFWVMDELSPIVIESLILEILCGFSRLNRNKGRNSIPKWLKQAHEIIHDRFTENLSLDEISKAVNVHETHLAREFRRFYHCTIGECIRRLKIEFACRKLAVSRIPLSQIALDAGFVDQSHFGKIFKQIVGKTPAEYRKNISFTN